MANFANDNTTTTARPSTANFESDNQGVDETGWGSFLGSVIGGVGAAVLTSFSGPGALAAAAGGGAVGSFIGTLAEEIVRDGDLNISKEELLNAMRNAGIDFALTATGGLLLKGAAKGLNTIPGVRDLWQWITSKAGVSVVGLAKEVGELLANKGQSSVAKAIVSAIGTGGPGTGKSLTVGNFLRLQGKGLDEVWDKFVATNPKVASRIKLLYNDAWSSSFKAVAKQLKRAPKRNAGRLIATEGKGTPAGLAQKLTKLANKMTSRSSKSRDAINAEMAALTTEMPEEVIQMLIKELGTNLEKFTSDVANYKAATKFWNALNAILAGQASETPAENIGNQLIARNMGGPVYRQSGGLIYRQDGGGLSEGKKEELLNAIQTSGTFTAAKSWLELALNTVQEKTGKTELSDQATYLMTVLVIKGYKWMVSEGGFPPVPQGLLEAAGNAVDLILYAAIETLGFLPWTRRVVPKKLLWTLRVWFWVTFVAEGASAAILDTVAGVDPELSKKLSSGIGAIEQFSPRNTLKTVLGDIGSLAATAWDAIATDEDEAKSRDKSQLENELRSAGDPNNPRPLNINPDTGEVTFKALGGLIRKPKSLIAKANMKAKSNGIVQNIPGLGTSPMNKLIGSPNNQQLANSLIPTR